MRKEETSDPGQSGQKLASFLRALRMARRLTLRQVERTADVSNAYLSQVEQGKIAQPSPHILQKLASCYGVAAEELMAKAGYIAEPLRASPGLAPAAAGNRRGGAVRSPIKRQGVIHSALGDVTREEEHDLLQYLAFIRSRNK
jgi:transcriptional regulator with XRE-family HTH domain